MSNPSTHSQPVIVIGTGSVGVHFVQELLKEPNSFPIKVFGGEAELPYKRENLSKMLAGDLSETDIKEIYNLPENKRLEVFLNNPVTAIDINKSEVVDSMGVHHPYKKLVFAVGSSPRTMDIPGNKLKHVFTFRNLKDAEILKSRQISSRNTVVIGGGLVGLDVAYAMQQYNTQVTVIEKSSRLMSQLLDDHASVYLRLFLSDIGIDVRNNTDVIRIEGDSKVKQVVLEDGEVIPCDTVIVSIGIKPNIKLAASIGLDVNRGILVNDQLETSQKNIYAIGECTEHRGRIYGIVRPGYDQAEVLAKIMSGDEKIKYTGSVTANKLGVVDYPILSIGENGDNETNKELMYRDIKHMVYRKLVLNRGYLHGVVSAGPWKESEQLFDMVEKKQYIWPWQRSNFINTGNI